MAFAIDLLQRTSIFRRSLAPYPPENFCHHDNRFLRIFTASARKHSEKMELPSAVFALALHPTQPLIATGLLEGHVSW